MENNSDLPSETTKINLIFGGNYFLLYMYRNFVRRFYGRMEIIMTTKDKVLGFLLERSGYISGEALAEQLGVSRNSVWKAVNTLRSDGFDIEAVTNKGYILNQDGNVLSEIVIRKSLQEGDNRKIYIFDTIDSTNNYAKELASEGAENGTLIISDMQTAGKGRMGRSFYSPSGGSVYMSVILRPQMDMESCQLITSCIAAAVADAVDRVCGTDVKIKWVNDLFLNNKKICGILTEASLNFENGRLDYAVVGIGINLKSVKQDCPGELLDIATSIEDETGKIPKRCLLIAEILKNIDIYTIDIEKKKFLEEYRRRSFIIGKRVAVSKFKEERAAQVMGIGDNAGLIVKYDNGSEETLNSGEARILNYQNDKNIDG